MLADYYELLKDYLWFKTIAGSKELFTESERLFVWLEKLLKKNQIPFFYEKLEGLGIWVIDFFQDPQLPTVLIYSHYDLNPSGLDQKWKEDPFQLFLAKDSLIAKGVAEEKWLFILLFKELLSAWQEKKLNYNVKIFLSGNHYWSINTSIVEKWLTKTKEKLTHDFVFYLWGENPSNDLFVSIGQKGLLKFSLDITPSDLDNPDWIYQSIQTIGRIYDANGRVSLPHFYFDVAKIPFSLQEQNLKLYKKSLGNHPWLIKNNTLDPISQEQFYPGILIKDFQKIANSLQVQIEVSLSGNQKYQKIVQTFDEWLARMLWNKGINYHINVLDAHDPLHFSQNSPYFLRMKSALESLLAGKLYLKYELGGVALLQKLTTMDHQCLSFSVINKNNLLKKANENLTQEQISFAQEAFKQFFIQE